MEEHVKIVGSKLYHEIPLWMNACDIFVLPSLNEENSTVMLEYLGCGKPFVGTKVGDAPELIVSDDYGLLCDAAKQTELAENVLSDLGKDWDSGKVISYASTFT